MTIKERGYWFDISIGGKVVESVKWESKNLSAVRRYAQSKYGINAVVIKV